jgi:methylenetetrahydrofolate reductase (NADPH)
MNPSANPTISFELAPPQRPNAAPRFWATAKRLVALHPDFISITYGAGGGDRRTAWQVLDSILHDVPVLPIAHLTCVGASRDAVASTINDFLDAGVRSFLALRGDPPKDQPDWTPDADGLSSAIELVHLLREVEDQRRVADPGQALRESVHALSIGVATFPAGNPAAGTSPEQELARLQAKVAASADFAMTQFGFEAEPYLAFAADARAAGIEIPILTGLIPVTSAKQLDTLEALTQIPAPTKLRSAIEHYHRAADQYAVGIEQTVQLAEQLLAGGAPGLHIFTFNRATPAIDLLKAIDHPAIQARIARELLEK